MKAGNQTARGVGRGLSERPMQRLQNTNGTLRGKKLRGLDGEIRVKLGQNLVRQIDVLAAE